MKAELDNRLEELGGLKKSHTELSGQLDAQKQAFGHLQEENGRLKQEIESVKSAQKLAADEALQHALAEKEKVQLSIFDATRFFMTLLSGLWGTGMHPSEADRGGDEICGFGKGKGQFDARERKPEERRKRKPRFSMGF